MSDGTINLTVNDTWVLFVPRVRDYHKELFDWVNNLIRLKKTNLKIFLSKELQPEGVEEIFGLGLESLDLFLKQLKKVAKDLEDKYFNFGQNSTDEKVYTVTEKEIQNNFLRLMIEHRQKLLDFMDTYVLHCKEVTEINLRKNMITNNIESFRILDYFIADFVKELKMIIQNEKQMPLLNKNTETISNHPRFCTECGNKLDIEDKFCVNCGAKIIIK
ncbi:MAG: hypothetical protein BroJett005_22000 [Ignavibacteriota bacterium]|nr:MAG: hypothetical protein BroJett005_22000 [Ignavibacteriota bacterium]